MLEKRNLFFFNWDVTERTNENDMNLWIKTKTNEWKENAEISRREKKKKKQHKKNHNFTTQQVNPQDIKQFFF